MKTKYWIIIGIGVVGLTTVGIIGYKKGWFKKKGSDASGSDSSSDSGSGSSSSGDSASTTTTSAEKKASQDAITLLAAINNKARDVNNKSYSQSVRDAAQRNIDSNITEKFN
jgi:hypothetical protein